MTFLTLSLTSLEPVRWWADAGRLIPGVFAVFVDFIGECESERPPSPELEPLLA